MYHDGHVLDRNKFLDRYGEDKEELYNHIKELDYVIWRVKNIVDKVTQEDKLMGRVKDWLIEMEEDASDLSLSDWIAIHGVGHKEIWERINSDKDQFNLEL